MNKKIMKKLFLMFIFVVCLFSFACSTKYTVNIYVNGNLEATHSLNQGDKLEDFIPEVNTPIGHTYSWHINDDVNSEIVDLTKPVTSDLNIYCVFSKMTFTVKFLDNGNVISEEQYQYGDVIKYPTVEDKVVDGVNYVFEGFDSNALVVEENLVINTIYGEYYTVTFYDGDTILKQDNVKLASSIALPNAPTKEGYDFVGWDKEVPDKMPAEHLVFNAKWDQKLFTITFYDGNDEILQQQKLPLGAKIIAPENPTKEDKGNFYYVFDCWDTEFDVVTGDMDIYPFFDQFTHSFYSAKFYNENEKLLEEMFVRDDELINIDLSVSKKGTYKYLYNFIGWTTEKNSNQLFDFSKPILENTKFYPVFEEVKNTQEFDFTKATVSILGDSISTFYQANSDMNSYYHGENEYYYPINGRTVSSAYDTWWGKFIFETKTKFGVNASLSGSTCYNWGSSSAAGPAMNDTRIKLLGENGKPDIILIYIGTNDNVNGFTTDQFRTAYETMLSKIALRYPNAYVFCLTMGYCNYSGYFYTETNRLTFNNIIRKVATEYNASIIDIANVQTTETYSKMLGDALHPSKEGMSIIAAEVIRVVEEFFTLE